MVRKTKKNVKSNSLQKNWYYGIKYIDSMNKYWYSSFYSLYVNGWITHIFLLKNMLHITVTFIHLRTPTVHFESTKRRIRIDWLQKNLMIPEWLYYTTSSKVPEKKPKLPHHTIHAFSIFKKEIRDQMM